MNYPKEIIVSIENAGTEDEFLAAYKTVADLAIVGEKVNAARYKLIETIVIDTQVVTKIKHKIDNEKDKKKT